MDMLGGGNAEIHQVDILAGEHLLNRVGHQHGFGIEVNALVRANVSPDGLEKTLLGQSHRVAHGDEKVRRAAESYLKFLEEQRLRQGAQLAHDSGSRSS